MKKHHSTWLLALWLAVAAWSPLVWQPAAKAGPEIAATLNHLIQHPALSRNGTGVQVVSLKTGKIIYQTNQTQPLSPASNMKLVTSAASLALLKPEFTFKTMLYSRGKIENGVLYGNLYLKGYGDPDLSHKRLEEMVQQLKFAGVERVEGNLVLDDTYFDQQSTGRGWKDSYGASAYSARISALSLNQNTVTVWIRPSSAGKAAVIELEPPSKFFVVKNQVVSTQGRSRLQISRFLDKNGVNQIHVKGTIYAKGRPESETINLDKPSFYTGAVFHALMMRQGVAITGKTVQGATPAGSNQLAVTYSAPLREIVTELNKHSINMLAETLLKFLGATFEGPPGTAAKGEKAIARFLKDEIGISSREHTIVDGSGLSPLNRITPQALNRILTYMFNRFDLSADYIASLAVSGVDGTLKNRLNAPETKRKIRAKTGFINGVSALSGYIYSSDQDVLVFSILMNQFQNLYVARTVQDRICAALVRHSNSKLTAAVP